ncbi:hypothetical protein D3C80_848320 [compost metagenome]
MAIVRVFALYELHQLRIKILPVGNLAAIQLSQCASLDQLTQRGIRGCCDVVSTVTCEQLHLKRRLTVEGVVQHLDAGPVLKVFDGVFTDQIRPVVDPNLLGSRDCRADGRCK